MSLLSDVMLFLSELEEKVCVCSVDDDCHVFSYISARFWSCLCCYPFSIGTTALCIPLVVKRFSSMMMWSQVISMICCSNLYSRRNNSRHCFAAHLRYGCGGGGGGGGGGNGVKCTNTDVLSCEMAWYGLALRTPRLPYETAVCGAKLPCSANSVDQKHCWAN